MEKEAVFLLFVLSMACLVDSARGGKLCDFQERFKDVRPSCRKSSNADGTTTSKGSTYIKEDNAAVDVTSANDGVRGETATGAGPATTRTDRNIQDERAVSTAAINMTSTKDGISGPATSRGSSHTKGETAVFTAATDMIINKDGISADSTDVPSGDTYTQEDETTFTATTEETTNVIDCFEMVGNATFPIMNGSSTLNADCTKMITCTNGEINLLGEYNCSTNAVCEIRNSVRKCYCINGYHGNGEFCSNHTNCLDIFNDGNTASGIYTINPSNWNGSPFQVYCNMSEGGRWTVFQRRVDGSVDFYRNWQSYKEGFGELDREFWLGNDKLYYITNDGNYTLRIDLVSSNGNPFYAEYELFLINDENDNYRLSGLGEFNGTAGNALLENLNYPFTTPDRDNDASSSSNCADVFHGAWWYRSGSSNLNGDYRETGQSQSSVYWDNLPGSPYNIKYTEMKIRPII